MKIKVWMLLCSLCCALEAQEIVPSFFQYPTEALKQLEQLSSQSTFDGMELRKWDAIAIQEIQEKGLNFFEFTRLFCYLYVAQCEASKLSQNLKGEFKGSLDPISHQVLSLFLPDLKKPALYTEDPYSLFVADLIKASIEKRLNQENMATTRFSVPPNLQQDFSAGLEVSKWNPWFAKPSSEYWPPAPPSANDPIWKEQILAIKQAQTPMTEQKKEIVYKWAGLSYPWSADYRTIANEYMLCHQVPLDKMIATRAALMVGLYDCIAAYITCKYHYLVIRPKVFDPTVQYLISVPKHPSYPSGHATESTVTTKILSFFFPENSKHWEELGKQCRISRIWAGIHYPIDNEAGEICGNKVATTVLAEIIKNPNP